MQNNTELLCADSDRDNEIRFDLLPDYITTVNSIIEYIEITETDIHGDTTTDDYFSPRTIKAIKALDPIHAYNDDLFDAEQNKVISVKDARKLYILVYNIP